MRTVIAKGGDMSTNQILRFYDNHIPTSLTIWKKSFFHYNLLVKRHKKA